MNDNVASDCEIEVYAVGLLYRGIFRHMIRTMQFGGLPIEYMETRGLLTSYFTIKGQYEPMKQAVGRLDELIRRLRGPTTQAEGG